MYILTSEWMTSSKPTSELFECDCHQQFSGLGTSHNASTLYDAERVNVHWKQTNAQHSPSADGFDEAFPSFDTKPLASQIPIQRTVCSIQVHHPNPSSKSIIRILRGFPTATSATAARRPCEDSERRRGEDSGCGGGGARDRNCNE